MYTVVGTDHVEDWFVVTDESGTFECIDDAIVEFERWAQELLERGFEGSGLDEFLWDVCTDNDETPEESGLNYGCHRALVEHNEALVTAEFVYDPAAKVVRDCDSIDITEARFSPEQRARLVAACRRPG